MNKMEFTGDCWNRVVEWVMMTKIGRIDRLACNFWPIEGRVENDVTRPNQKANENQLKGFMLVLQSDNSRVFFLASSVTKNIAMR